MKECETAENKFQVHMLAQRNKIASSCPAQNNEAHAAEGTWKTACGTTFLT